MAGRARGRGRGGSAGRGRGGSPAITPTPSGSAGLPPASAHIQTVGVKRSGYGTSGQGIRVQTNHFEVAIPKGLIFHYDGTLSLPLLALLQLLTLDLFRFVAMASW